MKKNKFCVFGRFFGKDYSKPGFDSYDAAMAYATLKGWSEIEVASEGAVEQPAE